MASNNLNFPSHPPPAPTPEDHPTVIIVVVISFGCLFIVGAIFFFILCLFKRHCKKNKFIHERKDMDVDEHLKVQELVLPGPHGPKTMVLSVEGEIRVHKDVHKDEVGKGIPSESKVAGEASTVEGGVGSSHPDHQV